MKRFIFLFSLAIAFTSCDDDDNLSPVGSSVASVNEALLSANTMRINEFIEDGVDKTNIVSPYQFSFVSNGTVIAAKPGESINGTYLVFSDDNRTELRMNFPLNSELYELTDDWYLISNNGNIIRFEDSGDVIQFQKQ
jgi:hypothetical protein